MFTEQTLKFLKSWIGCNTLLGVWRTHLLQVLCSDRTQYHSTQPICRPLGYKMKFTSGVNTSHFPGADFDRLDAMEIVAIATFLAFKNEFCLCCKHSFLFWKDLYKSSTPMKTAILVFIFLFPLCTVLWCTKTITGMQLPFSISSGSVSVKKLFKTLYPK